MDILSFLLNAVLTIVLLGVSLFLLWWALWIVPLMLGSAAAGFLWKSGHDNLAVLAFIIVVAGGYGLLLYLGVLPFWESGSTDMSDKGNIYDKSGNIKGYFDKE